MDTNDWLTEITKILQINICTYRHFFIINIHISVFKKKFTRVCASKSIDQVYKSWKR